MYGLENKITGETRTMKGRMAGSSIFDFRSYCRNCGEYRYPKQLNCPICGNKMRNSSHSKQRRIKDVS